MTTKCLAAALLAVLLLALPAGAKDDPERIGKLFAEAVALSDKGEYEAALEKYEEILALDPDAPGPLYNGGMAAYHLKRYADAEKHWKRLKGLDPEDWGVRAKLVQVYQALEKTEARDAEIKALYELRKETENEKLKKLVFFCRDQFEAGGKKVMVFEHFELKGDRAIRYWFGVLDEEGEEEYHLSLGSYAKTHAMAKEMGLLEKGQRYFHLDGYWPNRHATFRFFRGEPSYDEVKKLVVAHLRGEQKPISSSTHEPAKED